MYFVSFCVWLKLFCTSLCHLRVHPRAKSCSRHCPEFCFNLPVLKELLASTHSFFSEIFYTLATRHRLQWFMHLQAHGLRKGDEHPAYTSHGLWHTLPSAYQLLSFLLLLSLFMLLPVRWIKMNIYWAFIFIHQTGSNTNNDNNNLSKDEYILSSWWRGTVVERRSLAGELPCPALDLQLMGDH